MQQLLLPLSCCCTCCVAQCSQPPPRYQSKGYGGAASAARQGQPSRCSTCSPSCCSTRAAAVCSQTQLGYLCRGCGVAAPATLPVCCGCCSHFLAVVSGPQFSAADPRPVTNAGAMGEAASAALQLPPECCSSCGSLGAAACVAAHCSQPPPRYQSRGYGVLDQQRTRCSPHVAAAAALHAAVHVLSMCCS